ncbi:Flp family type IVb pilin [Sphingomonas sp. ABOLG]|uniref:Flp family type IVb pilin n=1 Tax=unclassified Sphingomonas TaxID=196159 RepID=UPI000F7EBBBF|nr:MULTISPECIES: Flp family type IVb pilin [unclassified Sphingomonas]MDF2604396.1 pilus assembly protein [Sphingomonas sp.]RSV20615.1 Flp family type IVb pilin [Sphingomonas sp. ABOLG]
MHRGPSAIKRALAAALRLAGDQRGATAVEYGLIVALIVIVIIAGVAGVADETTSMWNNVSDSVSGVVNPPDRHEP